MKLAILILLLSTLGAEASITTNVVHVEKNTNNSSELEVLVTHEGRVFTVDSLNQGLIHTLLTAKKEGLQVELEVEEGGVIDVNNRVERIIDAHLVAAVKSAAPVSAAPKFLTPMTNYQPSNVSSLELATQMFKTLNNRTQWFSQCFNRAHIWAKQLNQNYGVNSMKILIYYTKRFRKEVSGKWWFHIAPMISVNGQYYVMDREFTREPVTDTNWEKKFTAKMRNSTYRCKKIDNIKEYYDQTNMAREYCNIQHTSMYYWEPNDMSKLDKEGVVKNQWVDWEIRAAAKEAFRSWRDVYSQYRVR